MPISVKKADNEIQAPHFKEALRVFLEHVVGKEALYCGGLVIQSTMCCQMQEVADRVFKEQCAQMRSSICKEIDGAVITMDVKTGAIRAMVGGFDYQTSKYDRALHSKTANGFGI